MLYTRKGDTGSSGLFRTKERLPKDHPIYEALGTLDELGAFLGLCRARVRTLKCDHDPIDAEQILLYMQECLFVVQAEIAGGDRSLTSSNVTVLEQTIDRLEDLIEPPHSFVISGTTEASALYDYARTIARRAERAAIAAKRSAPATRAYLNRLSSLLYVLARHAAYCETGEELQPSYLV